MQSTTSSTRTFITPPPKTEVPEPVRRKRGAKLIKKSNLPWLIVALLLVASLFLLVQYHTAQTKLSSAVNTAQQVNDLVNKVHKIVVLPSGETPTVATVVHAEKLRSQSFFTNAQDGDKVLVYAKQREAILYRPGTNQIVTIAPVNVAPDSTNLSK